MSANDIIDILIKFFDSEISDYGPCYVHELEKTEICTSNVTICQPDPDDDEVGITFKIKNGNKLLIEMDVINYL